MKKIHIIGISGTGKTYLSQKISQKLDIKIVDLDNIQFLKKYSKKRTSEDAKKILIDKISSKKKWITEGIYTEWINYSLENSDIIIWIDIENNFLLSLRIIQRYLKRNKKENILSLLSLLKFQWQYKKTRKNKEKSLFTMHQEITKKHLNKLKILQSREEVDKFIDNL